MKMNDIFSGPRFLLLAKREFILKKNMLLVGTLGSFLAIMLMSLIFFLDSAVHYTSKSISDLNGFFIFVMIGGGILFTAYAFPYFRSKQKTMEYLLVPNSIFEKWIFEFIFRMIIFLVLMPIVFYLAVNSMSVFLKLYYWDHLFVHFQFVDLVRDIDANMSQSFFFLAVILGILNVFSLGFLGAAHFTKNPFFKSIITASILQTLVSAFIVGTVFLFKFNGPQSSSGIGISPDISQTGIKILLFLFLSVSLIILQSATYYKLKEKEV